ncbi:MAG: N-acetylneuraminate synthase [Candidatus Endolissoclinum sp. TMED37]|nr:MAG: N-acetylneuraminate synthase [Candidatus Endolissoclinum sp. TMED37]|tara:strand:- start:1759 stop:2604 length:846 start_codon:yes stop_codon:yes gene_type:complete
MNKTFIISEIGINHNGDIDIAKKMIQASKEAGADAVKFQKRTIELVYSKEQLAKPRISPFGSTEKEQKEGLEFDEKDYDEINKYCKEKKIIWFASAWDLNSLKFLDKYNLKYNKIASAMIVDEIFLNEVAKRKKHTFISTGMSDFGIIDKAVNIFKKNDCPFELMHCISAYPFENEIANLNMIQILKEKYKCNVGYSGHEKSGKLISLASICLGSTSLERHLTLDRTMYGSDQAASITPNGFKSLVSDIRVLEKSIRGSEKKIILDIEKPVAKKLRSHIKN